MRFGAKDRGRRLSPAVSPRWKLLQTCDGVLTKAGIENGMDDLERRRIGERVQIIDPPRMPERPVGPRRSTLSVVGGLTGFALALAFVGLSSAAAQPHRQPDT